MAKKSAKQQRPVAFKDLKVGDRFQFVGKREGTRGRKPIFTKSSTRAYMTRLNERVDTRALSAQVKLVAR